MSESAPLGEHHGGREVTEYVPVALLGDLRVGADIDDEWHAVLLANLRERGGLTRVPGAAEHVRAFADEFFGLGAPAIRLALGVAIHPLARLTHRAQDPH